MTLIFSSRSQKNLPVLSDANLYGTSYTLNSGFLFYCLTICTYISSIKPAVSAATTCELVVESIISKKEADAKIDETTLQKWQSLYN